MVRNLPIKPEPTQPVPAAPPAATVARLAADYRTLDLTDRLAAIRNAITGRIIFTTSFGLEDQAIAHALFDRDLAIEVVWTSGGIEKLDVYRGLGIGEVWLWREGIIEVHVLLDDRYERRERSALLPDLDLVELARHIDPQNQTESVRRYRQTLRPASA